MPESYNKLVRDNIPDIVARDGRHAKIRSLHEEEFLPELTRKLQEEVREFADSHDVQELGDILEVIYALGAVRGVSVEELERIRLEKRETHGGFEKGIFLIDA